MKTMLADHRDTAYALLRIVSGFLFLCHGAQKLFGVMGRDREPIMSLMGLAGAIEFVGGLALMLGFLTGIVAFLCSGQMAVAYFMAHQFRAGEDGMMLWLPIRNGGNGGELAVLYCFLFLFIAMAGAGKWSLDNLGSHQNS